MSATPFEPGYLRLHHTGELEHRARILVGMLDDCRLCPRACGVNRREGERGFCRTGVEAVVSSATEHFGEEPGVSGARGSGTIFFRHCNLRCVFCQNHQISQNRDTSEGEPHTGERLARSMLRLQAQGVHNINLVSPSHVVPQIVEAVSLAAGQGLNLPLVYNSNGYDSVETLKLLDGIVDVYMPDLKWMDPEAGLMYSNAEDYPTHALTALKEMYRQVGGDPVEDEHGVVLGGLIVRHLVMPNDLADSEAALAWVGIELGPKVYLSLMAQYYPTHRAMEHPLLSRAVRGPEYLRALEAADKHGLDKGWRQQHAAVEYYRPDFSDGDKPFQDIDDFRDEEV